MYRRASNNITVSTPKSDTIGRYLLMSLSGSPPWTFPSDAYIARQLTLAVFGKVPASDEFNTSKINKSHTHPIRRSSNAWQRWEEVMSRAGE